MQILTQIDFLAPIEFPLASNPPKKFPLASNPLKIVPGTFLHFSQNLPNHNSIMDNFDTENNGTNNFTVKGTKKQPIKVQILREIWIFAL